MEQTYCDRLRKYREANRLTQEELAEKIGLSRQTISKWERGEASPDTDNLLKLSALYGISIDALLKADPVPSAVPEDGTEKGAASEDDPAADKAEASDEDGLQEEATGKRRRLLYLSDAFVALLCATVYLCLGFFFGLWHPGWLIFLLIPIWCGTSQAILQRNVRALPIPTLIAAVYLLIGCCFHLWHPSWLIFLLIPLWYVPWSLK